ncbi:MAG: LPP20 family lipoprotein [Sulfurimonas sp.]|nr:LPP20 family lipoprotein [Sulfurimonas sp.]
MKIFIILLSLALLFLSGCSVQKRVVSVDKKELPAWFVSQPKTTSNILYATGEGKNREEAIKDALSLMSSTLSVYIASKFDSKKVENMGIINNYQQTIRSEIGSSVKKIRISNYELLKSQEFSFNRHIVLIKSDKKILFESLKKELEQKFMSIEKRQENLAGQNILKQFRVCKDAKNSLINIPNTIIVMSVLDKNFDSSDYIEKLQSVNSDYDKLESNITFSIETNEEAKDLEPVIRSGLSKKRLQILAQKEDLNTHLRVIINSKIEKAKAYGFVLARSAISIVIKDYKGIIIGSNKLNIIGQSTQGYADAKEHVAEKLNAMVKKDGIEKVIGLSF